MKTLWVAVGLSLVSVCQPGPLTCDKLTKPVEKSPDISGRWHYIALSTGVCLPAVVINSILWPSVAIDVSSKGTPNHYSGMVRIKMYGYCENETDDFFHENNKIFDVDSGNVSFDEPYFLQQTSCSDCIVVKTNVTINSLSLFSKRTTINEDELKEFEKQAECFSFSKPEVLNADYDFDNCHRSDDDVSEDQSYAIINKMYERVKSSENKLIKCVTDFILSYIPATFT